MPPKKKSKKSVPRLKFPCLTIEQGKNRLVCFAGKATTIWEIVQVNKRDPDKDQGYQRVLSGARLASIAKYIRGGNPIPNSILISFTSGTKISNDGRTISIPKRKDAGWVIDGQHRLAGVHESQKDIELVVIGFINLPLKEQIREFVTINKEAKGVPTSLYYDLLKHLPPGKTDAQISKERASDIADMLRKDEQSSFFGRLVIISSPKRGEISLTNFVRKVAPLVQKNKGKFHIYSAEEQKRIINNYFKALESVFPKYFEEIESVFFQTLGFGALINALPTVFDLSVKYYQGFTIEDATKTLKCMEDFDFSDWKRYGTGSAAEIQAGEDMRLELLYRIEGTKDGESLRL